jgi:hypothetical protein
MFKPLETYRNSDGSRLGSVAGICTTFLFASWYLTKHPNMTYWPVTALCFGMGATGFLVGGIIGAMIDPPKTPEARKNSEDSA